jgi:hypothetical protein
MSPALYRIFVSPKCVAKELAGVDKHSPSTRHISYTSHVYHLVRYDTYSLQHNTKEEATRDLLNLETVKETTQRLGGG